jgi:hypothetical protein
MSARRHDLERAGQDEQDQPYQGKHRAPESKSRRRERSGANAIPDQPADAPHPLPDTPGQTASEVRGDPQAVNDQQ